MSHLTNRLGLPAPLVKAVERDPYDDGGADISVTRLIDPPRKVELERLHKDSIVEDVADRIFALIGQIGHLILERAGDKSIVEQRLFADVLGWKVSGQMDYMPNEQELVDYKLTSIWAFKDGVKAEYVQQVNLLAYLAERNNIIIKAAKIIAIYRDWSQGQKWKADYPEEQVQVWEVPLWSPQQQEAFMKERVMLHQHARLELPHCTPEETWKGKRCERYCRAAPWCFAIDPLAELKEEA